MVNRDKVEHQLALLQDYLALLKDTQGMSRENFLTSKKEILTAERCLQLAIECLINIGNHIVASEGYRAPKDYGDVFQVLGENGVVNIEDVQILKEMVKFRNRLVHLYWDIEPGFALEDHWGRA